MKKLSISKSNKQYSILPDSVPVGCAKKQIQPRCTPNFSAETIFLRSEYADWTDSLLTHKYRQIKNIALVKTRSPK